MKSICYIFRRPGVGFSIETLFENLLKTLPASFQVKKVFLPYHKGTIAKLKNLWAIRKLSSKCDIVHITGDVYYSALSVKKAKLVITYHDLDSLRRTNPIANHLLQAFWIKLPMQKADAIVAISRKTYQDIVRTYPQVEHKTLIIPNCIEDSWFLPEPLPKSQAKTALIVGTKANKNLDNIAKALQGLSVKVIIIGKLSEAQRKAFKTIQYENHVNLTRSELRKIYLKADFLLFPSIYEGFGLPIIEAQALSLPVITSNIEPMLSVSGGKAILVNPFAPEQIRRAIIQLQTQSQLREELSIQGFQNAQKYRCSQIVVQYSKLYEKLL